MELFSYYYVAFLYLYNHQLGINGTHNQALLDSPSYTGDKDRNLFLENSPSYTRDTLSKLINIAHTCATLPKKPHFNANHYSVIPSLCQTIKDMALQLEPLEHKRLVALQTCPDIGDKESCPRYYEVLSEIKELLRVNNDQLLEIQIPLNEYSEFIAKEGRM